MIAKGVLPEFQEFLLTNKLAPEKHVLFLAVWVSKFLAFSNRKGQKDIGLTVTEFLDSLEAREDMPRQRQGSGSRQRRQIISSVMNDPGQDFLAI